MISAMGMVQATVKVPQGLPCQGLDYHEREHGEDDDADERAHRYRQWCPATGPISERTMSPSERPSRRVDKKSTVMSWTAPAKTTPARIQSVPGR